MSILALDARKRWEQRKAHAAGEAFDASVEERPASNAALDVLWAGGHGLLTERQFRAGDWLRMVVSGRPVSGHGGERVQGGCINPVERKAVSELYRGTVREAALRGAEGGFEGAWVIVDALIDDLPLAAIARRCSVHHEIMRRRIPHALDALADYKYGCDADVDAWNAKASAAS